MAPGGSTTWWRRLEPVLDARGRGPLRTRVEAAWLRLGGPACARSATDVEDAVVFLDLLEELEEGGDLEDFAALDAAAREAVRAAGRAGAETLQVMTIHKSKGLEFDTVIVPGLGYRTGRDDPQLLQWLERPNAAGGSDLLLGCADRSRGATRIPVYRCGRGCTESASAKRTAACSTWRSRVHASACT